MQMTQITRRTSSRKTKNQKGFTLIEVIVSVFIFSLLAYGVILLMSSLFTDYNKQSSLLDDTDQARKVLTSFTDELRSSTTGADGSFALNQAGNTQIIFFSSVGNGGTIYRYRYYVNGTTLYRGIVAPTANFYNTASEVVTPVQTDLANGATPAFFYYDGNYDGTTAPLAQPVNLTQVKFVKMNLIIKNKAGLQGSGTFTVTAGATIRNLKNNLGN